MSPPRKRRYLPNRRLEPACRELTLEQEERRRILRECINLWGPYSSDAAFAREQLERPPRTVRAWLAGYRPIPPYIGVRLATMRESLRRKAREQAREELRDRRIVPEPAVRAKVQKEREQLARVDDDQVLVRRAQDDGTFVESYESGYVPLRLSSSQSPARQKSGETSVPLGVTRTAAFGTRAPFPWTDRWLCRCSDPNRKTTWRKAKERTCARCGMAQPPAE